MSFDARCLKSYLFAFVSISIMFMGTLQHFLAISGGMLSRTLSTDGNWCVTCISTSLWQAMKRYQKHYSLPFELIVYLHCSFASMKSSPCNYLFPSLYLHWEKVTFPSKLDVFYNTLAY